MLVRKRQPRNSQKLSLHSDHYGLLLNRDLFAMDFASANPSGASGIDRKSVMHNY
jgi:hypothetical protein